MHGVYLANYTPINSNISDSAMISMPFGIQPNNINHNIHFTYAECTNDPTSDACKSFGTLPESSKSTGQFLGYADHKWNDINKP